MNKRQIGTAYEEKARAYLEKEGYQILQSNYRCRIGEIDLIGYDGATLCFVEVKYRSSMAYGHPLEAVGKKKAQTIRLVAQQYLQSHEFYKSGRILPMCRFDVIAILGDQISLVKNAF